MFHFISCKHLVHAVLRSNKCKPFKNLNLESPLEENLISMFVSKWDCCCPRATARLHVCFSVLGRVVFCWAWLLLSTCQALVNTIWKKRLPFLDSFLWPRGMSWRTHLGICSPPEFLWIFVVVFCKISFWQLKNYSYRTFIGTWQWMLRLYNFSQGPETWIWIKLNKKYLFFSC